MNTTLAIIDSRKEKDVCYFGKIEIGTIFTIDDEERNNSFYMKIREEAAPLNFNCVSLTEGNLCSLPPKIPVTIVAAQLEIFDDE